MKEQFIQWSPRGEAREIVEKCVEIVADYQGQGFDLSIRQLYYQLVSKNIIKNSERSYKSLITTISQARLAGLIDWEAIVDRGRETHHSPGYESAFDFMNGMEYAFRLNMWNRQPCHLEVMVEKQALEGVLIPVCDKWQVPFSVNKGYSSQTALYTTGKRLEDICVPITILYLGDHDPSGIDMTRDVQERLSQFANKPIDVDRVALNMDQVRQWNLPPNPTKMNDTRSAYYVTNYGLECWELDAIEPSELSNMVEAKILACLDPIAWRESEEKQKKIRNEIKDSYQDL